MKIAVYLDDVSNSIDNAMQWAVMRRISESLGPQNFQIIDPLQVGQDDAVRILLQQEYDILLTYNRTGTNLMISQNGGPQQSVLSLLKRKHVAWLVEHPLTFYAQYKGSQCDRHFIFPNECHSIFSYSMGLNGSYSVQMFGSSPVTEIATFKEREFDVCIAAQWRGPAEDNAFWGNMTGKIREFFEDVLCLQDNIDTRDTFMAFITAAKFHGIPEEEVLTADQAMKVIYWYARKKERIRLVQDFADSGLKVALIGGEDWKFVLPRHENIHFVEPLGHEQLKGWYQKCKTVVTTNNFHGANERVFDAMAAGCLVFGECAPSLIHLLGDKRALFYRPNKAFERIPQLRLALKNGSAEEMAHDANHLFLKGHTWDHRAQYLSAVIEELSLIPNP